MKRSFASLLAVVVAVLAVGATSASAHHGGGLAFRGIGTSKLVTAAAVQLNVPRASLVAAIESSADAKIDAAVASHRLTSAQAADLKVEIGDNLAFAYRLSSATTVASSLKIGTDALNAAFGAATKALLNAKIDAALAAGKLSNDQAAALKAKVAALTVGYKAAGGFCHGGDGHFGFRRHR